MQPRINTARRRFLKTGAATAALAALPRFRAMATGSMTVDPGLARGTGEVARRRRDGSVTSVELVRKCYERIDAVNPIINAVVAQCRERALSEAAEADTMLKAGKPKGPLHGVPFTVKDSFDTAGVVRTGGTLGRKDFVPGTDATVVARARAAGAILLGKTNTPEFTLGGGGKGTVNLVYGLTKNPYDAEYQPSGSSGGAGAIVAAAGAYFDIGSDYGGSIRGPAYANGIAGIKPTYGRVPRTGHIVGYGGAFDNFQETGPLARRVEDLKLLMPVLVGPDDWDAAMAPVPLGDPAAVDLKSLRVAFYTTNGTVDPTPELQATVTQTVGLFRKLGAKVTEDRPPKMSELARRAKRSTAQTAASTCGAC
jgi:amidase